jgi:hypothetical protein
MLKSSLALALLIVSFFTTNAQRKLPILDMHMHARTAAHYGPPPQPMCAPVEKMPLWDPKESWLDALSKSEVCKHPVWSPKTDEEVMRQTVAVMERFNMFGMLGGKPELWRNGWLPRRAVLSLA